MMARKVTRKSIDRFDAIGIGIQEGDGDKVSPSATREYVLKYSEKYPQKGKELPPDFVKYLIPDPKFFQKKKKAKRGEWLACQKESGQTFVQWLRRGPPMPFSRVRTIYLLPLSFFEDPIPYEIIEPLQTYAEIFFQIPVKVMKAKNLKDKVPNRINDDVYQVDAGKILEAMKPLIPSDAFCVAGITMCDLYPRESWNFVFGLANLAGKSGVYSLARYLSNFGENQTTVYNPDSEKGGKSTIVMRACKTMCHEIGHMFGMMHCIYYECLMNGSNHMEESDSRPIFLCPVCLRKLQLACKFDIQHRYLQMIPFLSSQGRADETILLQERLKTWE